MLIQQALITEDFKKLIIESTTTHYPNSSAVGNNFLIHNFTDYSTQSHKYHSIVQDQWYSILLSRTRLFAIENTYKDTHFNHSLSYFYTDIITEYNNGASKQGNDFARACANNRIWNSLLKHWLRDSQ